MSRQLIVPLFVSSSLVSEVFEIQILIPTNNNTCPYQLNYTGTINCTTLTYIEKKIVNYWQNITDDNVEKRPKKLGNKFGNFF